MKKLIKVIFILSLIIIFLASFSKSYQFLRIDNIAVVVAIGIDVSSKDELQLSFQFSNASPSSDQGSSSSSSSFIYTLDAPSITSGISLMNTYLEKELSFSHCKLIAFSEQFAKDGISNEVYTLVNNPQIRPSTNMLITKSTAKEYLETVKPSFENLLSEYYGIYDLSSEFTGYTANMNIGYFFHSLECDFCQPYAILGGITSSDESFSQTISSSGSQGKSGNSALSSPVSPESIGIAVFDEDKLIGELNAIETAICLTTKNAITGFLATIPDPVEADSLLDIYITPSKNTDVEIDIVNGSPLIKINYTFSGTIQSMKSDSEYLDPLVLERISNYANTYLESIFKDYFYKTSKEFGTDTTGLGKYIKSNFLTVDDAESFNWNHSYSDAFFDITVNTNIVSSSLLSET